MEEKIERDDENIVEVTIKMKMVPRNPSLSDLQWTLAVLEELFLVAAIASHRGLVTLDGQTESEESYQYVQEAGGAAVRRQAAPKEPKSARITKEAEPRVVRIESGSLDLTVLLQLELLGPFYEILQEAERTMQKDMQGLSQHSEGILTIILGDSLMRRIRQFSPDPPIRAQAAAIFSERLEKIKNRFGKR